MKPIPPGKEKDQKEEEGTTSGFAYCFVIIFLSNLGSYSLPYSQNLHVFTGRAGGILSAGNTLTKGKEGLLLFLGFSKKNKKPRTLKFKLNFQADYSISKWGAGRNVKSSTCFVVSN